MRATIIGIIFAVGLSSLVAADDTTDLVLQLLIKARRSDLTVVTLANRNAVINLLRDIATHKVTEIGTILPSDLASEIVLLRLADPPTMKRITDEYRRGNIDKAENMEWAAQGALIPYLATDFFLEDGDKSTVIKSGFEGIRVLPPSVYSALISIRIIAESAQFKPETRAWAEEAKRKHYPYSDFRGTMRQWWRQNEAAFAARDYQAVRPPQSAPEAPPKAVPPASAVTPIPPPPSTPKLEPLPLPLAGTPPTASKSPGWPWILGIPALIGSVIFALTRRQV